MGNRSHSHRAPGRRASQLGTHPWPSSQPLAVLLRTSHLLTSLNTVFMMPSPASLLSENKHPSPRGRGINHQGCRSTMCLAHLWRQWPGPTRFPQTFSGAGRAAMYAVRSPELGEQSLPPQGSSFRTSVRWVLCLSASWPEVTQQFNQNWVFYNHTGGATSISNGVTFGWMCFCGRPLV